MNNNFKDLLADNGEVLLDSLLQNEILREIPVLGNSVKIMTGIQSLRDKAYLNKVKRFMEQLGEINQAQRKRLIDQSTKDKRRRVKFGDAIFTTIEQSDSLVKTEYLAIAFEAFLHEELNEVELRLICHAIRNSFSDELISVIEDERPGGLEYVVPAGLAEAIHQKVTFDMRTTEPHYKLSTIAEQLRAAWRKYRRVKG